MLERVTAIVHDFPQLMHRQSKIWYSAGFLKELQEAGNRGSGGGADVMDDNGLLWVAPLGKVPRLAVPQSLDPGNRALAHSTYRHPGTARTTALISRRYCWPTLIKTVETTSSRLGADVAKGQRVNGLRCYRRGFCNPGKYSKSTSRTWG